MQTVFGIRIRMRQHWSCVLKKHTEDPLVHLTANCVHSNDRREDFKAEKFMEYKLTAVKKKSHFVGSSWCQPSCHQRKLIRWALVTKLFILLTLKVLINHLKRHFHFLKTCY